MKFLKSHFALTRSQQNGIFLLVIIIILLQLFIYWNFNDSNETTVPSETLLEFQKELDSIRLANPVKKDTIYPFNPNFLSDYKAYQIGMKLDEIDKLLQFRQEGKWVNTVDDFQQVTGISDSLLEILRPSIRFPDWVGRANSPIVSKTADTKKIAVGDLNTATAQDLKVVYGIGDKLSERIVKYRNSLGGFAKEEQLQDVYGLDAVVIANILERFKLLSKPDIEQKNINKIGESELADIPYINSTLARKITSYKAMNEGIRSFEELTKISGFPSDKIDIIKLYLSVQ